MRIKDQKGVSIILTILIMAAILAIALGVSRLTIGEIKLSRDIPKTLIAYYVADAGIESALYYERAVLAGSGPASSSIIFTTQTTCLDYPANNICYNFSIDDNDDPGFDRLIKSQGVYKDIERAIELNY